MSNAKPKLIPSKEVRSRLGGVSNMTIWRWINVGILPSPIKINSRNYWPESEIDAIAERAKEARND